jgi:pimeloyl-ACP methyl ester carboxylesterase
MCPDSLFIKILEELPNTYPYEVHHITTEDQYILRAFRIQAKNTKITSGKKVVFLQHGLIDSADGWVINTEDYSLGLVLANKGYDVWLGNSRGNKYSMETVNVMKPKEYWEFSFQQMGRFDVPANIAYVLAQTGQATLSYAGHSQGTSQMFAALSYKDTKDYVNSKVNVFIALAPIVYLANQDSTILNIFAYGTVGIKELADTFHVYSIFPGPCSETSAQAAF